MTSVNTTGGTGGTGGADTTDFDSQIQNYTAEGQQEILHNMEFANLQNKIADANKVAQSRPGQ